MKKDEALSIVLSDEKLVAKVWSTYGIPKDKSSSKSYGLTSRQLSLLNYIASYIKTHEIPPSFDEMKDAIELKSKSGVHRLVNSLEERGFIMRLPNRARSIGVDWKKL